MTDDADPPGEAAREAGGPTLVERVAAWLWRNDAPPPGVPWVVACSGGPDSTALLAALAACGRGPLHAVYVDHGLRDAATTAAEAALVRANAARCGATSERVAVIVPAGGNVLAAAREVRYRALAGAARAVGAKVVAAGHTATDQAETVLFRALRGDATQALAGMPARRVLDGEVELLRPLLDVWREETAAYAALLGLPVAHDATNLRDDLTRTRLRRWIGERAGMARELATLAATTAGWVAACDAAAAALGSLDALDAAAVASAGPEVALRLLRRAGVHRAGRAHVASLLALASSTHGSRAVDLGAGLVAERRYATLRIGPRALAALDPGDLSFSVRAPGRHAWLDGEIVLGDGDGEGELLAADPLSQGLCLRNFSPGDRLQTRSGRRKLQDVLTDWKVPRATRRRVPLLAVGSDVVWLGARKDGAPGGTVAWGAGPGSPASRSLTVSYSGAGAAR